MNKYASYCIYIYFDDDIDKKKGEKLFACWIDAELRCLKG